MPHRKPTDTKGRISYAGWHLLTWLQLCLLLLTARADEPVLSTLLAPQDGTLQDERQPIEWSESPAAQAYYLWVGSSPGGKDLYQTGETSTTSIKVPEQLPRNKSLYARHHTKINGQWFYRDSTFTIGAPAILTQPTEATLAGSSVEFVWQPVAAAEGYRVTLGSKAGLSDYHDGRTLTTTHSLVEGLPINRTIHVRLHTKFTENWLHRDSTTLVLKTATFAKPPSDGVIDLTPRERLTWESVPNASDYYIWLGNELGTSDIYNSGETQNKYINVEMLPLGKVIFARLHTKVEGTWHHEDAKIRIVESLRRDQGSDRYTGSPPFLFTSWEFVCLFLPFLLMVHRWLGAGRAAIGLLVVASFVWYSVWDWRFGPLILLSLTVNWLGARLLERRKQGWLYAGLLLFNLLPLLYFKYMRFLFSAVGASADAWLPPSLLPHVLPLGISFFTFQVLAYVTDVYRGKSAENSWLHFAFFVMFFPQLVAGPIVHHSQILPQLRTEPDDRKGLFLTGCLYFVIGFVKKRYGADFIAMLIDPYFIPGGTEFADQSIVATIGYTLQLYFDFSGYSDMAVGLAALFGFRLPWNFNSPYQAASFSEFWQRWHITLSAFLRDYVYITLGGNRVAPWRKYFNLFATMVIGGFWHGAGWAFIAWGAGHGLLLCGQHLVGEQRLAQVPAWFRRPLVFACVAMLWIPFRAEDLHLTAEILRAFGHWRPVAWRPEFGHLVTGLLLVFFAPNSHAITAFCQCRLRGTAEYAWGLGGRLGWYALAGMLVSSAIVTAFYRYAPDAWLRRHLPLAREANLVRNNAGDLRTNINRAAIFSAKGERWVIAGPSYAGALGYYTWPTKAGDITIGSTGIGGQSIASWIRIAVVAIHDPSVTRLYVACSPIGLMTPKPLGANEVFATEGADTLRLLGLESIGRTHSSMLGESVSFGNTVMDIATLKLGSDRYFQLQATTLSLAEIIRGKAILPVPSQLKITDLAEAQKDVAILWQRAAANPKPPRDLNNGADSRFKWEQRGLIETVSENGGTDLLLGRLIQLAKQHGVKVILYESPTLKHHPAIYPKGFFDRYQSAMRDLADRHGANYVDLSGLFPEDFNSMLDFCHVNTQLRPLILITLLSHTNHETNP